ncbi:hypothetical protein RFI_23037 [Reticulomyxa filosa]|uniref:Uncharacterized protein n=1 Tax=Reticulomyxa filosa TaxID=46433 RepID=X6ML28_RETFI|nr:hypothetical protein RFI_23037 [Reticulomyxa filosa]|eukprot:ETO14331.1 hypothetical protein RFI_23037 [Reticulomyxa filosa]
MHMQSANAVTRQPYLPHPNALLPGFHHVRAPPIYHHDYRMSVVSQINAAMHPSSRGTTDPSMLLPTQHHSQFHTAMAPANAAIATLYGEKAKPVQIGDPSSLVQLTTRANEECEKIITHATDTLSIAEKEKEKCLSEKTYEATIKEPEHQLTAQPFLQKPIENDSKEKDNTNLNANTITNNNNTLGVTSPFGIGDNVRSDLAVQTNKAEPSQMTQLPVMDNPKLDMRDIRKGHEEKKEGEEKEKPIHRENANVNANVNDITITHSMSKSCPALFQFEYARNSSRIWSQHNTPNRRRKKGKKDNELSGEYYASNAINGQEMETDNWKTNDISKHIAANNELEPETLFDAKDVTPNAGYLFGDNPNLDPREGLLGFDQESHIESASFGSSNDFSSAEWSDKPMHTNGNEHGNDENAKHNSDIADVSNSGDMTIEPTEEHSDNEIEDFVSLSDREMPFEDKEDEEIREPSMSPDISSSIQSPANESDKNKEDTTSSPPVQQQQQPTEANV